MIASASGAAESSGSSSSRPGASRWAWLLVPGGIYLAVLFVLPLIGLFLLSFGVPDWTLADYLRLGQSPVYVHSFRTTVELAVPVTVISFLLGYPVAYAMATGGTTLRTFLLIAVILPYFTSLLARTFAWIVLLGRSGVINDFLQQVGLTTEPAALIYNRTGVIVGMTHVLLPLMVLPMFTVMRSIDQKLIRAARTNGASPLAAFLTIYLPLSLPGCLAGAVLVFITALGFYVTPALLGGLSDFTSTMLIAFQVSKALDWNFGSALSVILLAGTLVFLWIGSRFFPVEQILGYSGAGPRNVVGQKVGRRWLMRVGSAANVLDRWLPSWGGRAVPIVAVLIAVFLLLPVVIVAYLSFSSSPYFVFPVPGYSLRNYQEFFSSQSWTLPTITSIRVALMATAIATALGTMLAFGLSRGRVRGRGAMTALALAPIIMPTIVVAIGLYFVLVRVGLQGTEFGLALGHAVPAIPFVVVVVIATLRDLDPAFERAARSLGAGPLATFRTIVAPIILPALIVGAFFAFLTSFDDVVYVLFMGAGKVSTLPLRMWEGILHDINPTISAVATLQIALAAVVIVIGAVLGRRQTSSRPAPRV